MCANKICDHAAALDVSNNNDGHISCSGKTHVCDIVFTKVYFGWAAGSFNNDKVAARLDDVMNVIPARLTALLIATTQGTLSQMQAIAADARLHRSPNAGWPEAALSRGLDVALAGPRAYDGQMRDFPFVNPTGRRNAGPDDIAAACAGLWRAWALTLAILLALHVIA